jgi:DNA-binding MarR family transcriptional regulator
MSFCFDALKSSTIFNQIVLKNLQKRGYTELSPALLTIFAHLAESEPMSATSLANVIGVSRQAMHKSVNILERLGHVTLETRPSNRKEKIVVLTGQGEKLVQDAMDTITVTEKQMADFLGSETYTTFLGHQKALTAFLEALENQTKDQGPV